MRDVLKNTSIADLVVAISRVIDWSNSDFRDHNKRVAYIACEIAKEMGCSDKERNTIAMASLIHDIGILSDLERKRAKVGEFENDGALHCKIAYYMLKDIPSLKEVAEAIFHHHTHYDSPAHKTASLAADIISVADSVDLHIDKHSSVLTQTAQISIQIGEKMGTQFNPNVVSAFMNLAEKEAFWLQCSHPESRSNIVDMSYGIELLEADKLKLIKQICYLADFRSKFTASHSTGVTAVAAGIGKFMGFNELDMEKLYIAGLLHDIGKLAISADILEKSTALSEDEFRAIKSHSFLTHIALSHIPGLEEIDIIASRHHETLDGRGYPYRYDAEELPIMARIMRIADVYTALTEVRSYRAQMSAKEAVHKLFTFVRAGDIDAELCELLEKNILKVDAFKKSAQEVAEADYLKFAKITGLGVDPLDEIIEGTEA